MATLSSSIEARFLPPAQDASPALPVEQIRSFSLDALAWTAVSLELLTAVVLMLIQGLLIGTLLVTDTSARNKAVN